MPFNYLNARRKEINIDTPWIHQGCQKCGKEEQYKLGYRKAGLAIIPDDIPDTKISWLDIQADVTCNGGCLICGPWNSSYWQSELTKYKEYTLVKTPNLLEQKINEIFSNIDTSELVLLQFLGGEPFLSDADQYALPRVLFPEKCKIKYTTNGSVYPQANRIKSWEKFKSVQINFSIDATGKQFEYLRYPLQWSKVEENIKRLIMETDSSVEFHINHTLTPLNIYYYQEFEQWVNETFPKNRFTGIHAHTAYGTMNVGAANNSLRKLVEQRYGKEHTICKLLEDNQHANQDQFWSYINLWDQRRKLDWKNIFPDIVSAVV